MIETEDGATILFSATQGGGADLQVMAVPASGRTPAKITLSAPGRFIVYDSAVLRQKGSGVGVLPRSSDVRNSIADLTGGCA